MSNSSVHHRRSHLEAQWRTRASLRVGCRQKIQHDRFVVFATSANSRSCFSSAGLSRGLIPDSTRGCSFLRWKISLRQRHPLVSACLTVATVSNFDRNYCSLGGSGVGAIETSLSAGSTDVKNATPYPYRWQTIRIIWYRRPPPFDRYFLNSVGDI
jgi:hypothetical protein